MKLLDEKIKKSLLDNLPPCLTDILQDISFLDLREIRLRSGKPIMLYYGEEVKILSNIFSPGDISDIFGWICKNSIYAYLNEICSGFITLSGGHRVGISGECVVSGNEITNVTNLCGINIRIAREFKGCGAALMPHIKNGLTIKNTIIVAPPACGKTTMLRDIARIISQKHKVAIIDERSELGALYLGEPQFDIGPQTDVISKAPKTLGMAMALRALSPDVIITDEVGTKEDIDAMEQVIGAGCKIITSIHGYSVESIKKTKGGLLSLFDTAITLKKENGVPKISKITDMEEFTYD